MCDEQRQWGRALGFAAPVAWSSVLCVWKAAQFKVSEMGLH
jgi:hypothetical protein